MLGPMIGHRQNRGRDPGGLEMLGPMIGRSREPDTDPEVARDAANSAHTERPGRSSRKEDLRGNSPAGKGDGRFEEAGAKPYPGYDMCLGMLAGILRDQGDFAAARPLYEHALAVTKAARGERHRDYAIGLVNLAFLLMEQDDVTTAGASYLEQALEISKTGMGRRHPDYARISIGLAWLRHLRGEDAAARPLLERALAITEATSGELNLANAKTLSNLGWLLAEMGDRTEALRHLGRALGVYQDVVVRSIATLPERQRLSLIDRFRYLLDSVLSLTAGHLKDDSAAYRHLLFWKGLIDSGTRARRLAGAARSRPGGQVERASERAHQPVLLSRSQRRAEEARSECPFLADRYAMEEARLAAALGTAPTAWKLRRSRRPCHPAPP